MSRVSKLLGVGIAILVVGIAGWVSYSFYIEREQTYRSRLFRARSDIHAIESAVDKFRATKGRLPMKLNDLIESDVWPSKSVPVDPWGHPYKYLPNADGTSYAVSGVLDSSTQRRTGLTEVSNRTDWEIVLRQ
jgi:hypothetical protein